MTEEDDQRSQSIVTKDSYIRPPPELIEEPEITIELTIDLTEHISDLFLSLEEEVPEHTPEKQQQIRSRKRSRSNSKQSMNMYKRSRYNEDTTD